MKMKKWQILGLAISAVAGAALLAACGGSSKQAASPPEPVKARVFTVRVETVPNEVEAPGTVQSVLQAALAARVMANVVSVPVREGDFVQRGQLLVQLDAREMTARNAAAQAAVDETAAAREQAARGRAAAEAEARVAAKTYERFQFLQKEKSVSPQEFEEVEAKFTAAQAALGAAKARQDQAAAAAARAESEARAAETVAGYARITAPFDGVVVRRNVDPGTLASPGMTLLVVEDSSRYRMDVTLPASAAIPRRGEQVRIRIDALPGREFQATVSEVQAGADPASQTIRARLDLPRDSGLRSGWFGRAWFARGERQAIFVPEAAVLERGQLRNVFVLDPEKIARLRLVTLGASQGDRLEVLSGLQEGEQVVLPEPGRALEGRRVEAQP